MVMHQRITKHVNRRKPHVRELTHTRLETLQISDKTRSRNCSNANDQESWTTLSAPSPLSSPALSPVSSRAASPEPLLTPLPVPRVCSTDTSSPPPVPAPRTQFRSEHSDEVENKSSLPGSSNCDNTNDSSLAPSPPPSPPYSPVSSRSASPQPPSALSPLPHAFSKAISSPPPVPAPRTQFRSEHSDEVENKSSLTGSSNCDNTNDQYLWTSSSLTSSPLPSPAYCPVSSRSASPLPRACSKAISSSPPVPAPRTQFRSEHSDEVENKSSLPGSSNCANANDQYSWTSSSAPSPPPSPAYSPVSSRATSPQPPSALLQLSCSTDTSSRPPVPAPRTLPVQQRLKSEHAAEKDKNPGNNEETIPGGSQSYGYVDLMQTSDGLNDDVADVPVLTENPYEEVKPRQRDPSESGTHSITDEDDDDELSDWDDDSFDSFTDSGDAFAPDNFNKAQGIKQKSKLEHIVTEVHSTEKQYVVRLGLVFRLRSLVVEENQKYRMFPDDIIPQMFSNIESIYQFHNDFLLPHLQQILIERDSMENLGYVMKKLAPFLKLTSEYVTNFVHARDVITQWKKKSTQICQHY
ncbi:hypothetical protein LSAT2_030620 [Lamellibrachia satsuma]|nr:hypothetical protein LSAT2_030620 [Lamellibrachia satsuma]